ncbi:hypothetical protein EJ04DRAFT_162003 [Polyplosphaeria fusca]|uniref:Uncharacterized protein n=1 Tax=Polyplosphaeria fusca TaxID=682080 RepID=A0A9P4RBT7_9PLEO|nr:hypothetical protein EJ04DRAFT_162003 [Polyplosphaeria fusca]
MSIWGCSSRTSDAAWLVRFLPLLLRPPILTIFFPIRSLSGHSLDRIRDGKEASDFRTPLGSFQPLRLILRL